MILFVALLVVQKVRAGPLHCRDLLIGSFTADVEDATSNKVLPLGGDSILVGLIFEKLLWDVVEATGGKILDHPCKLRHSCGQIESDIKSSVNKTEVRRTCIYALGADYGLIF